MLRLITKLKIKEGKMEEALGLFKELVKEVKKEKGTLSFPALEWSAAMCSHIPNRG